MSPGDDVVTMIKRRGDSFMGLKNIHLTTIGGKESSRRLHFPFPSKEL